MEYTNNTLSSFNYILFTNFVMGRVVFDDDNIRFYEKETF